MREKVQPFLIINNMAEDTDPAYLYRFTTLGEALQDTLNDYCESGDINEQIRESFLASFDNIFYNTIESKRLPFKKFNVSGYLHTYR
jgi:hypothetical protein